MSDLPSPPPDAPQVSAQAVIQQLLDRISGLEMENAVLRATLSTIPPPPTNGQVPAAATSE